MNLKKIPVKFLKLSQWTRLLIYCCCFYIHSLLFCCLLLYNKLRFYLYSFYYNNILAHLYVNHAQLQ